MKHRIGWCGILCGVLWNRLVDGFYSHFVQSLSSPVLNSSQSSPTVPTGRVVKSIGHWEMIVLSLSTFQISKFKLLILDDNIYKLISSWSGSYISSFSLSFRS